MIYKWTRSFGGRLKLAQTFAQLLTNKDSAYISNLQIAKLQRVWTEAISNVPYYHNLVRIGMAPAEIRTFDEFYNNVPMLTKAIIQDSPDLFRRKKSPDHYMMTAGSTGKPLQFGVWNSESHIAAANMNAMRLYRGMDLSHGRVFLIWGHSHLLGSGVKGHLNNWKRRIWDLLLGYRRVDAYHMERKSARRYMDIMVGSRPQIICGYSNAVNLFVEHNWDRLEEAKRLKVRFVICTSEMLPDTSAADRIRRFFQAPLIMEYGGVDFGSVAHKWEDSSFMMNWWSYLGEYLPNRDQDDSGTLLVTTLYPRYVPLIRYNTEDDIKTPQTGADRQILEFQHLEGRHHDILTLDNGDKIHSMGLFHCIHQETSVVGIQLVVTDNDLRVLLIGQSNEQATARIRRRMSDLHPLLAQCPIEYVQDLQTNRAGKRRWIVDRRSKPMQ